MIYHMSPDGTQQFILGKRLGKILLGTDDTPPGTVKQPILGRKHDHRRMLELFVMLDQGTGLIAIKPGHHDIDENHIRVTIGDQRQCFESIRCGHHTTTDLLQQNLGGTPDSLAIVDDHHLEAGDIRVELIVHSLYPLCRYSTLHRFNSLTKK